MRQAIAILLLGAAAYAQSTFQTTTQLVVQTVAVKGKDGAPVEGLTAKDFTVTEDGVPQAVRFVEFQKLAEASTPSAPLLGTPKLLERYPKTRIAAEPPGTTRYRDRRLMALYFDMTAMKEPDQVRALRASQNFVRTQMTAGDLMAIMMFTGGAVQVLQDFTGDRDRLLTILQTMIVGEGQGYRREPRRPILLGHRRRLRPG